MTKPTRFLDPTVTVDVVIFTVEDGALKALIIKRAREPFQGSPALPGGFIRRGETSVTAAERILADKAGVKDVYLEQLYTFDEPHRDPRGPVFSVTYFALAPRDEIRIAETAETQKPRFSPVSALPKLAFDHNNIIGYAVERLRSKLEYTNAAYSLLPKSFTLTELQKIYEAIVNRDLDKRNFRKKFKELGLIEPTGSKSKGGRRRPAELYRFKSRKPRMLKKFF
ncbi:MAG: NUDIX hydrolase [Patescibacteria group bacterium]|nr:NUDIX hydrolase [Patescibacteria group bacterium]